jgi:exopolysaccharide biosynthesis polyprenyl glycosylphosphotransferase
MTTLDRDPRAERMIELFASGRFDGPREAQRVRFRLAAWVVVAKLERALKRILDVFVALLALVLASPLLLGTALAVKLSSPGPIFFYQTRVGYRGKTFACYKFRSMYIDAERRKQELMAVNEADGPVFKMKRDPRITPVGRIIRKLSIDELPQLINVLRGEMSLVGPRPAVPQEVARYEFDQLRRLDAIPGITGLQQVSGRSDLPFKRWVELDLDYIERQSFLKDIEILLRTIPAVLFGKGAY